MMPRIDEAMAAGDPLERERRLEALREEVDGVNESTVADKRDLEWPARLRPNMIVNVARLWFRETLRAIRDLGRGRPARPDHQEG